MTYPWAAIAASAWDTIIERWTTPCPLTGCWFWTGAISRGGKHPRSKRRKPNVPYPSVYVPGGWAVGLRGGVRGPTFVAVATGRYVEGMVFDHRCRHSLCMNPGHMANVTPAQNSSMATTRRL